MVYLCAAVRVLSRLRCCSCFVASAASTSAGNSTRLLGRGCNSPALRVYASSSCDWLDVNQRREPTLSDLIYTLNALTLPTSKKKQPIFLVCYCPLVSMFCAAKRRKAQIDGLYMTDQYESMPYTR